MLAREASKKVPENHTKAKGSEMIDCLQERIGRGRSRTNSTADVPPPTT
jgi:hypothetical protein